MLSISHKLCHLSNLSVPSCVAEEGPESREAKEVPGGGMQHRGEGGRGGEEGEGKKRLKSQSPWREEERRKMKREGMSELRSR